MTKEGKIERECLRYLNENGAFAWKNQTLGVYDAKAGTYRKPCAFQIKGASDIICLYNGDTFFIEVKEPKGVQSDAQKLFAAMCAKHGVIYTLVRSVDELRKWWEDVKARKRKTRRA